MAQPIDFYFDFSSPYGYAASARIDAIAARHGRDVRWRPILLGAVFKLTGSQPLTGIPMKGDYSKRDFSRTARLMGLPFTLPPTFPFASVAQARAFYWIEAQDASKARMFARGVYHLAFGEGRDVAGPEDLARIAAPLGYAPADLAQGMGEPAVKERLKTEVDSAIARGVFGSPFIFVDDEPFWGSDRLDQVDRWLETGGW
ncbi:2-hydroxychromene-2-carboxylate isomerase [Stella humosa]|uniref:2-hydroxychromene-2-carboxylate isomerase n=1 Tax=Stella humosa TaxID=94 RepID=A0A3N1MA00_9PROT|nr:2-hydroxychromene-2-carboxylate isomerase [Stella humosa]ROQ00501.1 2-hydroxychromene-2-carboxylate isomerase [Stella humosa]BBK30255.1 2-hydroxychromene-2-carboxylate isomerase [Stella humosa]